MKPYILFISILFYNITGATNPAAVESELSFKITYHNYHLGYVKAVKHASDATHTYSILGKAEGDLFFKKIVSENSIYTVFEKNEFIKSTTVFKRNGKTLHNTNTTLLNGKYIISTVDKTSQLPGGGINFTVALLYFNEPLGIKSIYSEAWGKVLPLVSNESHYTFTIPDGTVCIYEYKAGKLREIIYKTPIGEIKLTKEEPVILTVSK